MNREGIEDSNISYDSHDDDDDEDGEAEEDEAENSTGAGSNPRLESLCDGATGQNGLLSQSQRTKNIAKKKKGSKKKRPIIAANLAATKFPIGW